MEKMDIGTPIPVHLGVDRFVMVMGNIVGMDEEGVTKPLDTVMFFDAAHANYLEDLRLKHPYQFEEEKHSMPVPILFFHTAPSRLNIITHLIEQHLGYMAEGRTHDVANELRVREALDRLLTEIGPPKKGTP
jgi:hypothetical protein